MDIIVGLGMILMLGLTIFHFGHWYREKWKITSQHLRAGSLMLICFTILTILLFGMRIFLKPEVAITYTDTSVPIFTSTAIEDNHQVVSTKQMAVCDVYIRKTYPLSVVMGRDGQSVRYKLPCDSLTPETKSDIAAIVSFLKEDTRNVGK